jgi:chromosome partitioning protein
MAVSAFHAPIEGPELGAGDMSDGTVDVPLAAAEEATLAEARPCDRGATGEGMRVIAVASQKGGAGKTTLCGHLAVQADLVGAGPVALVDTDPQGSLAQWWNARESGSPLFVETDLSRLSADLEDLQDQGVRLVFIDTPPAVTMTIGEIVDHADLVVIPARPSPHDLRALGATVDLVEARRKPMIFALNGATVRARVTDDSAIALSQHGTVAPVILHHRVDFATSMVDGRTVVENEPDSNSAREIIDLWQYIAGRLGKLERRRRQRSFTGPNRRSVHIPSLRHMPAKPSFGRRTAFVRPAPAAVSEAPRPSEMADEPLAKEIT